MTALRQHGSMRADGPATAMAPSLIRLVAERAWAKPNAIRLELGEPGVATPPHVVEAAAVAARGGATTYTSNAGIAPLREALADKLRAVNGFDAAPDQIVVGAGAVQALFATLTALVRTTDEVLLPDPSWPDYRMMCELLGVRPVGYRLAADAGYQPDPAEIASLIGPRTKVLMLNSPSNPLGVVHDPALTLELLELAAAHDLWVIADECYDQLVYDGEYISTATLGGGEHRARTVLVYSFSKVHAMTGWRVGYAVLPPTLAGVVTAAQEPIVSCVNTPAQYAALAAITGPQDHVAAMRDTFRRRRDLVCEALATASVDHLRPNAAFYVWLPLGHGSRDSLNWALELLDESDVAVAPGRAFGPSGEGYVRISLGADDTHLLQAVDRVAEKLAADDQYERHS